MDTTNYPNDKTNKLHYVAYPRKSTEDTEKQVMSIGSQIERIKAAFPDLDITFIKGDLDDKGRDTHGEQKSAFKPGRPLFDKVLKDIDSGKYDGIVAWHPDRISRNEVDAAAITYRVRQGVIKDLKFCSYNFDKSAEGIMMLQMTMSQSQYFSAKLSKDVKRGFLAKRQKGGVCGLPPVGYMNDKVAHTIVVDPLRFPLVRKCWDLLLTGDYSVPQIARIAANEWGLNTLPHKKNGGKPITEGVLYRAFGNVRYAGLIKETHEEDKYYLAEYPAMVTVEEFDEAQRILGKRGKPRLCKSKQFVLKGFIRCGECGFMITAEEKHKKLKGGGENIHRYYHCAHKRKDHCCSQRKNVTEDDLFDQLEELLDHYELTPELHHIGLQALDELAKKETAERDDVQAMQFESVKSLQSQLDRLIDMATKEQITPEEYDAKSAGLRKKLKNLNEEQIAVAERARNWYEIVGTTLGEIVNANERFVNGDILVKKHILLSIGQNPVLTDGKLTLDEFYWLRPIKENAKRIKEGLEMVRTEPQQRQKASKEALITQWLGRRDSNPRSRDQNLWFSPLYHKF